MEDHAQEETESEGAERGRCGFLFDMIDRAVNEPIGLLPQCLR